MYVSVRQDCLKPLFMSVHVCIFLKGGNINIFIKVNGSENFVLVFLVCPL